MSGWLFDLAVLVPDRNFEAGVRAILGRCSASWTVKTIHAQVFVHIERDPGCFHRGHDFLKPMLKTHAHALILLDRAGSGREGMSREALEEQVSSRLSATGWEGRSSCIVLDPELEIWVWSESPHVSVCLGWNDPNVSVRQWLGDQNLWPSESVKPPDPKLAMERVLRHVRQPRSSAIYGQLGQTVSLVRCTDPAFLKMRTVLQSWFGES